MKIIAGTTAPTVGRVEVQGVVAAILELGAAFHPEFTGRENAILYGALMGLDRPDMEARLPDILDFAETHFPVLEGQSIGIVPPGVDISPARVQPGDAVIVSGDLGRHGITIMSVREGLGFESDYNTPFVLGTASLRGSLSAAIRIALAVALNTHSEMW